MKEKLIAVVLLLILTAILPIAVSKCSERSFAKPTVSTSDTPEKPKDSGEILCALTAGLYKDSYSAETLKAIAILMNTNYKANPDSFKANDFLYEENASGSIKDVYGEIKKPLRVQKTKRSAKTAKRCLFPIPKLQTVLHTKTKTTGIFTALHLLGIVTKPILTQMPNVSE